MTSKRTSKDEASSPPSPRCAMLQNWKPGTVFTIGHSTLPISDFIDILQHYGIETLADIRTVPRSKHNPQFNTDALAESLHGAGISYVHMKDLGGLRHAHKDSPNTGWRNAGFRGYADYMQTEEFEAALERLMAMSRKVRVAIMCAEAVPWRCHRSLVADALGVQDVPVVEVLSKGSSRPHKLTPFAHVTGGHVTYPPEQPRLL
jgi:uncharacterized protein (DUF488 family)